MTRPRRMMVIYGTRPEAIKLAPLISSVDAWTHISALPVVTGQHREMLDQVNALFDIVPHTTSTSWSQGASSMRSLCGP